MAIYYPDAHPETVSVDGYISYTGAASWAEAYGATDGTAANDSATTAYAQVYKNVSGQFGILRPILEFDTRALPSGARITAATLSVYVVSKEDSDNDGEDYLVVVTANPASNTGLVTGDFDTLSATANSDTKDITSISTSAYLDFTLNATGISNIVKAGICKFGLREGHDILNHEYAGANDTGNSVQFQTAEGANKPKLTVTYTNGGSLFFAQL